MKKQLIEVLKDKELFLQEIYSKMPDVSKSGIRSILNSYVKKGAVFERIERGKYKLKQNA